MTFSQQIISTKLLQVGKKVASLVSLISTSFFTIPLFLVVVGSSMIFYYFILTYKELTPQQL